MKHAELYADRRRHWRKRIGAGALLFAKLVEIVGAVFGGAYTPPVPQPAYTIPLEYRLEATVDAPSADCSVHDALAMALSGSLVDDFRLARVSEHDQVKFRGPLISLNALVAESVAGNKEIAELAGSVKAALCTGQVDATGTVEALGLCGDPARGIRAIAAYIGVPSTRLARTAAAMSELARDIAEVTDIFERRERAMKARTTTT